MVGKGPFGLQAGQWTDDTSMALCLAESLLECAAFDPMDQLERYVRWWRHGHWSSTGICFDIGGTTRWALANFLKTGEPYGAREDELSAGNGSIMRLAPVPLYFAAGPRQAMDRAADSSRTTHGATAAIDACRYLAGLIVGALQGRPKKELLQPHFTPVEGYWDEHPLHAEISEVAGGSFRAKDPPEIKGTGFVVRSLEAALWAFHRSDCFEAGALRAVNLGDDADTTGAVYGQLAGAYYAENGIPARWRDRLAMADQITELADRLSRANG
jgi:ADP-ribosyl-[dinitrogen reductase] hydrolase